MIVVDLIVVEWRRRKQDTHVTMTIAMRTYTNFRVMGVERNRIKENKQVDLSSISRKSKRSIEK